MKRFVVLTLIGLCIAATGATAQIAHPQFGLHVGGNLAQLRSSNHTFGSDATNRKLGLTLGAFAEIPLPGKFSLQPEVLFTQKGGTVSESFIDEDIEGIFESDFDLNYLELPVLAKYSLPTAGPLVTSLYAGPYMAYSVKRDVSIGLTGDDGEFFLQFAADDMFKRFDYGAVFGIDFGTRTVRLPATIGVRYNLGIANVFKEDAVFSVDEEEVDLVGPKGRAHEFSIVLGVKLF